MSLSPQENNARGLAALQAGNPADAALFFEQAVAADPNAGGLWRNLAHARRLEGATEKERSALEAALALDARDLSALIRLAEWHERANNRREAMIHWTAVTELGEHISNPAPEFVQLLDHARRFCRDQQSYISKPLYEELGPIIDGFGESARRRANAFLSHALGQRRVYPNICAGLHYPFLPADEFFDDRHFPWFDTLSAQVPDIRSELLALLENPGEDMMPYVRMDAGVSGTPWDQLNQNLDWTACFLWEYGKPNQPVLDRCPKTAEALAALPGARIPGRAPSAFFSMLKPHTRIPPHTGVTNSRAIIHLPLIVPPSCGFRVGGETREWEEGRPFAFDDTIEHEAWNDSDQLRAVLIFDVWNPHLTPEEQSIVEAYYSLIDKLTE